MAGGFHPRGFYGRGAIFMLAICFLRLHASIEARNTWLRGTPAMAELAAANEEEAWSDEDWRAFPPLYTLQPHAATREAQPNVWIDLLWRWCKAQNSWTVDVASCDVFVNDAINRRLDEKGRREVAKAACRAGRGELLDNGALFMLEQQPKDLARQLYDWARATGRLGGVFTLAELEDDGPLAGADARLRTAALEALEAADRWRRLHGRVVGRGGREVFFFFGRIV